jgi:hypothetical protein
MKDITLPQYEKHQVFTNAQAAWRKDSSSRTLLLTAYSWVYECSFGLLKSRFNIITVPRRSYSQRTLGLIMRACVILHNMIIDDERDTDLDDIYETIAFSVGPAIHNDAPPSLAARIQMDTEMRDSPMYAQLQQDLVEHVRVHCYP